MVTSNYFDLLPPSWKAKITEWLQEDIPSFDYGGYVVGDKEETAVLYGKSPGVLAGVPFFEEIFNQLDCRVIWKLEEGQEFNPIKEIAVVHGKARSILMGERVALNILARCSGIATRSRNLHKIAASHDYKGVIAGTRKTTPGFRLVEKYGMLVGGADTHRYDLSSMIMIKDNHIWSQGSIKKAVEKAKEVSGFSLKIEVECGSEQDAIEAIQAKADIIMLDNFTPTDVKPVARRLKERFPHILIEISGGLTEENVSKYFCSDIDIMSFGSLSQSVPHVDFSLKISH